MVVDIQAPLTTPLTTHLTTHLTTPLATPPYYTPYVTPYYTPYATPYYTPYRTAFRRPPGPSLLLTLRAYLPLTYSPTYHLPLTTCFIQGVGNLWTDPQIHSLAGDDYGDGNLGVGGMALFFSTSRYGPVAKSLGLPLFALSPAEQARFEMPPSHTVAASIAYGCSLPRIRLQLASHAVAACLAYDCSLPHIRLQPASHTVAGAHRGAPGAARRLRPCECRGGTVPRTHPGKLVRW